MVWCKILALCVAVLASGVTGQEATVSLTVDKSVADVADTVTFICTITAQDLTDIGFLRWQRVVEGIDIPITMATNSFLEPAFTAIGRFSSKLDTSPTQWVGNITITGVTTEDTGLYRCTVPTLDVYKDSTLTVARDVTSVSMWYVNGSLDTEVTDGMEVSYKNGDQLRVKCKVSKVNPRADITIMVGDQILEADPTETRHFNVLDENIGSVDEWYTMEKDVKADVTFAHTGKVVTCRAKLPGEGRFSQQKSFTIRMDGMPPVIECPDTMLGRYEVADQRIVCNFTARPPITDASVQFYFNNKPASQNLVTIWDGQQEGEKSLSVNRTDSLSQVTLHFKRVFMQDFRNYTFVVENGFGRAEKLVMFLRDPNDDVTGGSATWCVSATLLVLTLIALQLH